MKGLVTPLGAISMLKSIMLHLLVSSHTLSCSYVQDGTNVLGLNKLTFEVIVAHLEHVHGGHK